MPEDRENAPDTLAQAEAAAAAARARADAARARAADLRRDAQQLSEDRATAQSDTDASPLWVPPTDAPRPSTWKARRLLGVAAALALLCALLGTSAYLFQQHRTTQRDSQHAAEYAAAARQGVVNLMAINFNTAEADVQRVLDNSTGTFKTQFEDSSGEVIKALKEAKVVIEVNVNTSAVESMNPDGAIVLVAATSQRGDAGAADRDPRTWRAVVTVARESGQLKISQLDFV